MAPLILYRIMRKLICKKVSLNIKRNSFICYFLLAVLLGFCVNVGDDRLQERTAFLGFLNILTKR